MDELCTVCCESCSGEREATSLPCGHTFHSSCLVPWLFRNQSCPNCRCGFDEDEESDDSSSEMDVQHDENIRTLIARRRRQRASAINRALRMAKTPNASHRLRRVVNLYTRWRDELRETKGEYGRENELQRAVRRLHGAETRLLQTRQREELRALRVDQNSRNEADAMRWRGIRRRYARQMQHVDKYRELLVHFGEA